jgi:hypothetical protein
MATKPNFFIVGAPKCGTTALSEYLKSHPNVYFSLIKEPNYFASDFRAGSTRHSGVSINSLGRYLELFCQAKEYHQAIGEASATYLASTVALRNIYQFNPRAKIIVMLRNPVDLVYAYHSQIVFNLGEDEPDFEKAWQLQTSRQKGYNIPRLCGNINVLQYRKIGQIGTQLEKLFTIFPRSQVKVVLFKEFKNDTAKVYRDVVDFLNLPAHDKRFFPVVNNNKAYKSASIARLTQKPPKFVFSMVNATKRYLKIDSFGIGNYLHERNNIVRKRNPLSQEFKDYLFAEYAAEVTKVEQVLNLKLDSWKR